MPWGAAPISLPLEDGRGGGKAPPNPSHRGGEYPESWEALHQSTYTVLKQLNQGFGGQAGVGLFPDWCRMDAAGGLAPAPGKDTRFGWEAVRLPFRVALDAIWFKEPRAVALLSTKFLPFFKCQWQAHGRLVAVYTLRRRPGGGL